MADQSRYDFCPKCGALARDGVCQCCGYEIPEIITQVRAGKLRSGYYGQPTAGTPMPGMNPGYGQPVGQAPVQPVNPGYGQPVGQAPVQPVNPGYGQPVGQAPMQPVNPGYGQPMGQVPMQPVNTGYGQPVGQVPMQPVNPGYGQPIGQMQVPMQPVGAAVQGQVPVQEYVPPSMAGVAAGGLPTIQPEGDGRPGHTGTPKKANAEPAYTQYDQPKKGRNTVVAIMAACFSLAFVVGIVTLVAGIKRANTRYEFDDQTASSNTNHSWNIGSSTAVDNSGISDYTWDTTDNNFSEYVPAVSDHEYYPYLYNSLKDDLSYSVTFSERYLYGADGLLYVSVETPRFASDVRDVAFINEVLDAYRENAVNEYEYYMAEINNGAGYYKYSSDAFVTYMDEEKLSVVFSETVSRFGNGRDDSYIAFVCYNFDLVNDRVFVNHEMLNMDSAFAADFRLRELAENGNTKFEGKSDSDVADMLNDDEMLVIFYTPRGMEVGLNLTSNVIYMTYEDYKKFLD